MCALVFLCKYLGHVHELLPGHSLARVILILILTQLTLTKGAKIRLSEKGQAHGPRPNAYQKGPEATSHSN